MITCPVSAVGTGEFAASTMRSSTPGVGRPTVVESRSIESFGS
jgi:hypothetical protein